MDQNIDQNFRDYINFKFSVFQYFSIFSLKKLLRSYLSNQLSRMIGHVKVTDFCSNHGLSIVDHVPMFEISTDSYMTKISLTFFSTFFLLLSIFFDYR